MNGSSRVSRVTVIAGLVAVAMFGLAGVILVQAGPESTQRLGLLFGLLGTAAVAFAGALRSDVAAARLNGDLDRRIQDATHRAMDARRAGEPAPPAPPEGNA